jgi:hypothetical protein
MSRAVVLAPVTTRRGSAPPLLLQRAFAAPRPVTPLLRRLDQRTGEEVAAIPLERLNDTFTQVAFGPGSVWVSSGYYDMGPAEKRQPGDVVFRIDPRTNQLVDRIPVDAPSGLLELSRVVWRLHNPVQRHEFRLAGR